MNEEKDKEINKVALLIACASVLQIAESLIPHPVPGIRFGLANMIALVALVRFGFRAALEVAVLRTVVSSFVLGTFMSPAFFLSFSGAFVSTLIMGAVYKLSCRYGYVSFSIIGLSLLGAVSHNAVQLSLVYLFLIKHRGIFILLPWVGVGSVITGWISGLIAIGVCRGLDKVSAGVSFQGFGAEPKSGFNSGHYTELDSPIHRLSPEIKIISVLTLGIIILFSRNFTVYTTASAFMVLTAVMSRVSFTALLKCVKRGVLFLAASFFMPAFFYTTGKVLLHLGPVCFTDEGICMGALFAFRIAFLMISASLLMSVTSPEKLILGIGNILYPVRIFGISEQRVASLIMASWMLVPLLWKKSRSFIKLKYKGKQFRHLIPLVSDLVIALLGFNTAGDKRETG